MSAHFLQNLNKLQIQSLHTKRCENGNRNNRNENKNLTFISINTNGVLSWWAIQ